MKPQPQTLLDYLKPFAPLIAQQEDDTDALVEAGKAYHLGGREYTYAVTLTGHMPVRKAVPADNNFDAA